MEPLQVLYQNEHYVAVNKPAGLLVHRSNIDKQETLHCIQILRDQLGKWVYPCHRLDKPTSGVLLFALDKDALRHVGNEFMMNRVGKTYHAIVRGWLDPEGVIDYQLKDISEAGKTKGGGHAVTKFRVLKRFESDHPVGRYNTSRYSLVELVPLTGRMHQIRRHLKHIYHPIIGDTNYGDGVHNRFFRAQYNVHRMLLNASRLEICLHQDNHPTTIQTHPFPHDFGIALPSID